MKRYMHMIGNVSPAGQRARDIVAALAPPVANALAPSGGTSIVKAQPKKSAVEIAKSIAAPVVGAAAGAYFWKRHRVLGLVSGSVVGRAIADVAAGGDRTQAACDVATEAAAVVGSLKMKRHPVVGYVVGMVAGGIATSFVEGSRARKVYEAWKAGR